MVRAQAGVAKGTKLVNR